MSAESKLCNAALAAIAVAVMGSTGAGEPIVFRSALDNSPIDLELRPGDELTEALKEFYVSGINPYQNQPEAVARGKELYIEFCQTCHMPDGNGKFGPSLIDDVHINPRAGTDVGRFEILMGGAFGAMRPFNDRMSQDEVLKILAYVDELVARTKTR